ncbi:hypothetical protein [Corynebacterium sp.]|uniref:hypothetical protein n=1 Tax=Corynebacterium sp. TaxID=1720 RepID=UPI002A90C2B4|nr:hypothetical protein [Corynebacterium sp.]MDY5785947.1 hypothetical protein [Corynebacterium sp.]
MISAVLVFFLAINTSPSTAQAEERIQAEANGTTMTKMTERELNDFLAEHRPDITTDSGFAYDPESVSGWHVENTGIYIAYDLIGDESLQFGTVGILFDNNGSMTQSEITAVGDENGGVGKTWIDHQLVSDKSFSEADADETMVPQSNVFSRFSDCMQNRGVPGWVMNSISIACSAVCVATLGTGCVACISAVAGLHGGHIGYCIAKVA